MADRRRKPRVRRGQLKVGLSKEEFRARFVARAFYDPAFDAASDSIDEIVEVAWKNYRGDRKSPRTRRAGPGFADPDSELPVEWLETRRRIREAGRRWRDRRSRSRVLLICGSARNDQTCPGEMSKSFRLLKMAEETIAAERGFETEVLDLSRLTAEYGRVIYPCKACVSTAMPLCHWPCSCYPNHGQGQAGDWMNEIYPKWVAAHGVMIVTPVNWYAAPTVLKLMIDRLVCADGGNPDPTTTGGKDPVRAKELELRGWSYPRHLAGRAFSVVVHGDAGGVETLRRVLRDWLEDMKLVDAGPDAVLGRYIGYYGPYATSHEDLDADRALHEEVRGAARSLVAAVRDLRSGRLRPPEVDEPRPK
jgi:multimeric flavodoxin WrbA